MPILASLVVVLWLIFYLYWAISAFGAKKNVGGAKAWTHGAGIRIVLFIVFILFLRSSYAQQLWNIFGGQENLAVQIIGVALVAIGLGFAVWARRHLGRNWSGTPNIKVDHELVTSGPYRFVRHPIYTGWLLAIIGSALVAGFIWFIVFAIFCIMFIWRIGVEEKMMNQLFPTQYPDYKKRTKALIPFVW